MASANPYRYAGYRFDESTGLYYLMARYYDAGVGRFITRDTFQGVEKDPLSLNLYSYTKNSPINLTDPSGHTPVYVPWGGGKYVNVTFEWNVMRLTNNDVVRQIVGYGGWNGAYRIANEIKWIYSTIFGRAFPVSTKSVAIEIIGHVVPEAMARIIGVSINHWLVQRAVSRVTARTAVIDIVVSAVDSNRWIWDGLSKVAFWLKSTY